MPAAAVRKLETVARVIGEYMMLRGPAPEELPELRALGYRPEAVQEVGQHRLTREHDLAGLRPWRSWALSCSPGCETAGRGFLA